MFVAQAFRGLGREAAMSGAVCVPHTNLPKLWFSPFWIGAVVVATTFTRFAMNGCDGRCKAVVHELCFLTLTLFVALLVAGGGGCKAAGPRPIASTPEYRLQTVGCRRSQTSPV